MESRMERHNEIDIENFQRSKKNVHLYKEVYGDYDNFENLPLSDNINEIDIENLKSLMGEKKEEKKVYKEEELESQIDEKVYDINAILEKAKEENAKLKKEVPINKNIPNYLANLESDKSTKEIILKYDKETDEDLPIVKEAESFTSSIEKERVNTSALSLEILSDLKPLNDTQVSEPINNDDIVEPMGEKDFFDNKLEFLKKDFEDENEDELFYEEKNHTFLKVLLILFGIAILAIGIYFAIKEYTNLV